MKPLVIIPARTGSKRLPGKNDQIVGGLSLIENALQHALGAGIPRTMRIVSTDNALLWTYSGVIDIRPSHLARDDTPMMDVVRYVASRYSEGGYVFDCVLLLQPTSPLRTSEDITQALALLRNSDAVISVVRSEYPEVFTIGHAQRLRHVSIHRDGLRLAVPNGAIYAITRKALDAGLDWWTAPVVTAYEMPPERSVDIDTIVDLEEARRLWKPTTKS